MRLKRHLTLLWHILLGSLFCIVPVASQVDISRFIMADRLDELYEPVISPDIIYPAELQEISGHYKNGDYRLTIMELMRIDRMNVPDGNRDVTLTVLGESYRCLGLNTVAARYFTEISTHYTKSRLRVLALYRLQDHYYREKDYGKSDSVAVLFAEQYARHHLYGASVYLKGKSLIRQGNYEAVIKVLQDLPKEAKYYLPANFLIGLCHIALSNTKKALAYFDFVASSEESGELANEARVIEGDLYFKMGKHETALTMYNNVTEEFPRQDYLRMRKAQVYLKGKDYRAAAAITETLLREFPASEYVFENCLLLNRCYHRLRDTLNVKRIKKFAEKYSRDVRAIFIISNELKRITELKRNWQQLEGRAFLISKKKGHDVKSTHLKEIKKARKVEQDLLNLMKAVDPTERLRKNIRSAAVAEQRYLTILNTDIEQSVKDSTTLFGDIQVAYLDLDTIDQPPRAKEFKFEIETMELRYNSLCRNLVRMREVRQAIIDECLSNNLVDRYTENMQAKFVDWGLIQNQSLKRRIRDLNRSITKESVKLNQLKKSLAQQQKEQEKKLTVPDKKTKSQKKREPKPSRKKGYGKKK